MSKSRALVLSVMWAAIVIAFPVASGVLVVVGKLDPTTSRLVQAAFMFASVVPAFAYCKVRGIAAKDVLLARIDRRGARACLWYAPLILVLLPMVVSVHFGPAGYVLATLLFTLGVGIAEELYFRGIILRLLRMSFGPISAVFISALIFAVSHVSGAFADADVTLVALSVANALLFGWLAAQVALLTGSIFPLMIFHCLFDFLTYQMLATGTAEIAVYAVRGALMTVVSVYLLVRSRRQGDPERMVAMPAPVPVGT